MGNIQGEGKSRKGLDAEICVAHFAVGKWVVSKIWSSYLYSYLLFDFKITNA